ncbi:hypothetical protein IC582_007373 [Cucumis melo]
MLLEGEGKQGGWKEREFSGIREFMVNHGRWADSILIQYEENEKSLEEEDDDEDEKDDDMEIPNVAMSLGKYGGFEGEYWDDAAFSSIQSVEITHEKAINSITIKYDQNGPSERHGGNRGCHTSAVDLEYPDEYLISIVGYMGYYGQHYVIRSLSLESNKQIYGPFGREEGRRFVFPTSGAKIVSFHGTSGLYLNSVGINVLPLQNNLKTTPL